MSKRTRGSVGADAGGGGAGAGAGSAPVPATAAIEIEEAAAAVERAFDALDALIAQCDSKAAVKAAAKWVQAVQDRADAATAALEGAEQAASWAPHFTAARLPVPACTSFKFTCPENYNSGRVYDTKATLVFRSGVPGCASFTLKAACTTFEDDVFPYVYLSGELCNADGTPRAAFSIHCNDDERFEDPLDDVRDKVEAAAPGAWAVVARVLRVVVEKVVPCYPVEDFLEEWLAGEKVKSCEDD
jgi:hypothetical protein